jgi:hypothetical protein
MEAAGGLTMLDALLDPDLRADLEDRFWRPIEAQATLEALLHDPAFAADPGGHPAMFADHGVVHVRDVAIGLVRLLDTVDGVLLPRRPPARRRFMETCGVALAYLHDIGMVDMTRAGRRSHPHVAAQTAFGPDVDPLVERLLGPGPVRARLDEIAAQAPFATSLELVVREMLGLSAAHSKSAVPAAVLDDRAALRRLMQRIAFTDLADVRAGGQLPAAADESPVRFDANTDGYPDPSASFAWLSAASGAHAALADDVIDALRLLRAADVLRQRGTVLRTSGGFELALDAATARAVCTLRPGGGDAAYVISYDDDRGAGEANIRVAFVTPQGHLRIAFHRGSFADEDAESRAAASVADVILDIQADVIPSFGGTTVARGLPRPIRSADAIQIQLERPDDRPTFADRVAGVVAETEPSLARRLVIVANVEGADAGERRRFYESALVHADDPEADRIVRQLAEHGADTSTLDRVAAFSEVCLATIRPGEVLVAPGSPPSFVYVPTGPGLVVRPDGGYAPSPMNPWIPVGTTGVIRRAERNSAIVAEREVDVIMIPGELYARTWLRPLSVDELVARLSSSPAPV